MLGIRLRDIGLLLANRVEGDQRIAVDVGFGGDLDRVERTDVGARRKRNGDC